MAKHDDIGAIVLECTNMPPYAAALRDALGLPVFDIYSLISLVSRRTAPARFLSPAVALNRAGSGSTRPLSSQARSDAVLYLYHSFAHRIVLEQIGDFRRNLLKRTGDDCIQQFSF